MTSAKAVWHCTFHYPQDWIEVLHPPTQDSSANGGPNVVEGQVQSALQESFPDRSPEERQQLAEVISPLVIHDAERAAAISAHGCREDEHGVLMHMHLAMWVGERTHPDSVGDELALLADTVREAGVNVEAPKINELNLPAGRALRVQQADLVAQGNDMTPVESVSYWLPVDGSPDMIWAHCWTPNLAFADDAVQVFDQIANAIVLERS